MVEAVTPSHYRVTSTSRQSAGVSDIPIALLSSSRDGMTRRILRPIIVNNQNNPEATVSVTICHQKRSSRLAPWEDVDCFDLRHLHAGEEVRLHLDSAQTLSLFRELQHLYNIADRGIPWGERNYVVVDEESVLFVP